jgi:hypothetical protein
MDTAGKEHGVFYVIHPERAFGVYDTEFIPPDDGGIVDGLSTATGNKKIKIEDVDDDNDDLSDSLEDVAEEVGEGVRTLEREVEGFRNARRKLR